MNSVFFSLLVKSCYNYGFPFEEHSSWFILYHSWVHILCLPLVTRIRYISGNYKLKRKNLTKSCGLLINNLSNLFSSQLTLEESMTCRVLMLHLSQAVHWKNIIKLFSMAGDLRNWYAWILNMHECFQYSSMV